MIHEYALEPELVASWHDLYKFHLFSGKFGFGKGRVVSRYPKKWTKRVWDAFKDDFGKTASPVDRKRMEKLLKQIANPVVRRPGCIWEAAREWLPNAESEHTSHKHFHTIVARNNPGSNENVMRESEFLEYTEGDQDLPKGSVPRNAEDMANCVAPMLHCATKILFIDPYFRAKEERFRRPLAAFLQRVDTQTSGITIELHTSASHYNAPAWDFFRQECEDRLPPIIPKGLTLTVSRWKERAGGEKLHNRYILTDIGGVSFLIGLDCDLEGNSSDVIARLSATTYSKLLDDYDKRNGAFDLDGEVFTVEGRSTS